MKKNIKKALVIIYMVLLCCVFFNSALSKNVSKRDGQGNMDTAGMILNVVTKNKNITNLDNTYQELSFTVNNYDGSKDAPTYNDTQYDYQISITTNKNVPLKCELYKQENGQQTKVTLNNGKTDNITMPHSKIKEDTYVLKVKLDNKDYKNIEDVLNIDVYALQS